MTGDELAWLLEEMAAWITDEPTPELSRHGACRAVARRDFSKSRTRYRRTCAAHPRPVVAPVPRGELR